jgi:membrane protease YdiL (CAAX protease family)
MERMGEILSHHPVLFAFFVLFVIFILYQALGGGLTLLLFGTKVSDEEVTGIRIFTMVAQILFVLAPTLFLTRIQTTKILAFLRANKARPSEYALAVLGVVALQGVLQVYLHFQEKIPLPHEVKPFVDEIRRLIEETYLRLLSAGSLPELFFVILIVAVVPAFCEEFLFRGLVQRNLEIGLKSFWGVVLGGFIFGAYHLNPFMIVPLSALGLYFGVLVYRTNSIFVSVAAHFTNNCIAVVSVYYIGNEDLVVPIDPAEVGVNGSVLQSLLLFVGLFLLIFYCFLKTTARRFETCQTE